LKPLYNSCIEAKMQNNIININLLDADKNYILISITPPILSLEKDDIELYYGNNICTDFIISDENVPTFSLY